jgi:hypothetical protein
VWVTDRARRDEGFETPKRERVVTRPPQAFWPMGAAPRASAAGPDTASRETYRDTALLASAYDLSDYSERFGVDVEDTEEAPQPQAPKPAPLGLRMLNDASGRTIQTD